MKFLRNHLPPDISPLDILRSHLPQRLLFLQLDTLDRMNTMCLEKDLPVGIVEHHLYLFHMQHNLENYNQDNSVHR